MKSIGFVEVERLQNMLIKKDEELTELKEHVPATGCWRLVVCACVAILCSFIVSATGYLLSC